MLGAVSMSTLMTTYLEKTFSDLTYTLLRWQALPLSLHLVLSL